MRLSIPVRLLSVTLLLGAALPAPAADRAGVSAAVRGDVALNRPATAVGHQVVSGEEILLQDAIRSGPRSGMQILLLDQTVFTIGPESALVIDEFVYDPKTNAGKLSAEVTKGVFRFVTGKIAHEDPQNMNVKLPAGTLGVRGTMVGGRVDPATKSSTLVLLGEGQENDTGSPAGAFEACNAGKCVRVSRPGFGTDIAGVDSPPSAPYPVPPVDIDRLTRDVSDPGGWTETAGSGKSTDVAAGASGTEDDDTRSAADASGATTASGATAAKAANLRNESIAGLNDATVTAVQSGQGRTITGCSDLSTCTFAAQSEGEVPDMSGLPLFPENLLPGNITTFQDVAVLGAREETANYFRGGIGLDDGGTYDFNMNVDFGKQSAGIRVSNLNSPTLGLEGSGFSGQSGLSLSSVPIPFAFITNTITDSESKGCRAGCNAIAVGLMVNGPTQLAEKAAHIVEIIPNSTSTTGLSPVMTTLTPENITVPRFNP